MVRVWICGLICLMFVSVADAAPREPGIYNPTESTPTTLYFHLSGLQDAMINTQKPDDRYDQNDGWGAATHSLCFNDPTGYQTVTSNDWHTYYARATPSIVQYDVDQGGAPRVHPEHGISFDVELDTESPFMFYWYLEVKMVPTHDGTGDELGAIIPNVVVQATMREGDDLSVNNEALNTGTLVAQGATPPTHLLGPATDSEYVTYHDLGDRILYEFAFPMEYKESTITAEEAYNVRVDVYMDNEYCRDTMGQDTIMIDWVRVHTSPDFRPRMDLSIFNPLVITALHPQFVGDDLVVHTGSNSPWGNYDVMGDNPADPTPMELTINGPSPALSLDQIAIVPHYGGHGHHTEAVSATWAWDYQADNAKDGVYEVVLRIKNDQETAEAVAIATFEIGDGGGKVCAKNHDDKAVTCVQSENRVTGKDSPLPVAFLLTAIAVAGLAKRRR